MIQRETFLATFHFLSLFYMYFNLFLQSFYLFEIQKDKDKYKKETNGQIDFLQQFDLLPKCLQQLAAETEVACMARVQLHGPSCAAPTGSQIQEPKQGWKAGIPIRDMGSQNAS